MFGAFTPFGGIKTVIKAARAIVARIEHGHSYPDVARVLGKPSIAAAHVAVSRALGKLAKEMQPEWA